LGLRDNENDSGVIRVYARRLKVANPSLTIPVSSTITTEQVIKEALARFRLEDLENDSSPAYQLVKVTLEAGTVTETILSPDDIPWQVLKRRGHESVRLMELTRFYLELQKDPHGPEVAMFIGNLPANLSQKQYEILLMEFLDEGILNWKLVRSLIKVYNFIRVQIFIHRANLLRVRFHGDNL
jgi:diacylglycerol kinase (ATP)